MLFGHIWKEICILKCYSSLTKTEKKEIATKFCFNDCWAYMMNVN